MTLMRAVTSVGAFAWGAVPFLGDPA